MYHRLSACYVQGLIELEFELQTFWFGLALGCTSHTESLHKRCSVRPPFIRIGLLAFVERLEAIRASDIPLAFLSILAMLYYPKP